MVVMEWRPARVGGSVPGAARTIQGEEKSGKRIVAHDFPVVMW